LWKNKKPPPWEERLSDILNVRFGGVTLGRADRTSILTNRLWFGLASWSAFWESGAARLQTPDPNLFVEWFDFLSSLLRPANFFAGGRLAFNIETPL
jgi:hypothetical protein